MSTQRRNRLLALGRAPRGACPSKQLSHVPAPKRRSNGPPTHISRLVRSAPYVAPAALGRAAAVLGMLVAVAAHGVLVEDNVVRNSVYGYINSTHYVDMHGKLRNRNKGNNIIYACQATSNSAYTRSCTTTEPSVAYPHRCRGSISFFNAKRLRSAGAQRVRTSTQPRN